MRRITYIHELPDWPRFHWSWERLAEPLAAARHRQGRLTGHMEALGFSLRQEAVLQTLTADVIKSSEIEGEKLVLGQVLHCPPPRHRYWRAQACGPQCGRRGRNDARRHAQV
jgi:Fic family protein